MKEKYVQKLLDIVSNNYQDIASEFDLTRKKELWPEIQVFAAEVETGARVLDLACGNGRLIESLKNKKVDYLGLDSSSNLIYLAQKNYPDYNFIIGDMLDLKKIAKEKYDYIFCLAALQHIPSKKLRLQVLQNINLKLAPGGQAIISNWNLWGKKKYRVLLLKNYLRRLLALNKFAGNDLLFPWKSPDGQAMSERYYHAFTGRELKKLAKLAKFEIVLFKKDKYNFWLKLKK